MAEKIIRSMKPASARRLTSGTLAMSSPNNQTIEPVQTFSDSHIDCPSQELPLCIKLENMLSRLCGLHSWLNDFFTRAPSQCARMSYQSPGAAAYASTDRRDISVLRLSSSDSSCKVSRVSMNDDPTSTIDKSIAARSSSWQQTYLS